MTEVGAAVPAHSYAPSTRVAEILRWAKSELDSIPYEATSRWAFYQVVQKQGIPKGLYRKFLKWTSRARKSWWEGWTPSTLMDDSREITGRGSGLPTYAEWVRAAAREEVTLGVSDRQKNVLLVLFEAAAMSRQFDHYLAPLRVATAPFQGDASIAHKWAIAKRLERLHQEAPSKPVVVLYFGDLDPKGLEIPVNALRDIWRWMRATDLGDTLSPVGDEDFSSDGGKFRWIRVGLNPEQIPRLHISDNPEKPGTYQWEALSDPQARDLILPAVRRFWDQKIVDAVEREEEEGTRRWRALMKRHAGPD
jgi:hypothetical protein